MIFTALTVEPRHCASRGAAPPKHRSAPAPRQSEMICVGLSTAALRSATLRSLAPRLAPHFPRADSTHGRKVVGGSIRRTANQRTASHRVASPRFAPPRPTVTERQRWALPVAPPCSASHRGAPQRYYNATARRIRKDSASATDRFAPSRAEPLRCAPHLLASSSTVLNGTAEPPPPRRCASLRHVPPGTATLRYAPKPPRAERPEVALSAATCRVAARRCATHRSARRRQPDGVAACLEHPRVYEGKDTRT